MPQRFYAFAEEKTIAQLPAPYGYPVEPGDVWAINYMLHNETPEPKVVWIQYDVDWVPASSPTGRRMKPARPLWIDVQNGKAYPVFDALRGEGRGGEMTYPDGVVPSPYGRGPKLNQWKVDRPGTLVAAAVHLHPGGLHVDLSALRGRRSAHIFRSNAHYFDPNGPVSWDLAMTKTPLSWRVGLRKGDVLRVSTTYETRRASWYESMGLVLAYIADGDTGPDPFKHRVYTTGAITHGRREDQLAHGGRPPAGHVHVFLPRTPVHARCVPREIERRPSATASPAGATVLAPPRWTGVDNPLYRGPHPNGKDARHS